MPSWFPINIYNFSSWARSTIVPLLILCHHRPIYPLPKGISASNEYLDELWQDASFKNVPYSKPLAQLGISDWFEVLFIIIDIILFWLGGLRWIFPIRTWSRRRCMTWIKDHQEEEGDWAGIFPPMHFGILALLLEGYIPDHYRVRKGVEAIERFAWKDDQGKRIQSCVSPVWDTVLMSIALCDTSMPTTDPIVTKALGWVKLRQICGPEGDWRIYSRGKVGGGYSFEYSNRWYPDVDDTAAAVIAFLKQDPEATSQKCVVDAMTWILGMQNRDDGWVSTSLPLSERASLGQACLQKVAIGKYSLRTEDKLMLLVLHRPLSTSTITTTTSTKSPSRT